MRIAKVAAAQLGPIQKADSRQAVVARMLDLMKHAEGCDLIVYPELALTTFFPRWYVEDRSEADIWFEREMPGAATRPLFEAAQRAGMAISFGYAERTPDGRRFNTSSTARCTSPVTPNSIRTARTSISRSAISSPATSDFRHGACWAACSACASATTGAGRRRSACSACRAWKW
jgi:hypothetical protein